MKVTLDIPESMFSALREPPREFVRDMRIAAAVKWYELGRISQGKAAELANVSRAEFINLLHDYGVSPFQITPEELREELTHG
jgi:predicted HTH domain antitoxin